MAEKFILIPSNPLNLGDFTLVLKSRRVLFMWVPWSEKEVSYLWS